MRPRAPRADTVGSPVTSIDSILDRLTLEQRIRQLLVVHLYGDRPRLDPGPQAAANVDLFGAPSPRDVVARHEVGGVVLVGRNEQDPDHAEVASRNVEDAALLPELVDGLQRAAVDATGVPLVLAVDQEQGRVSRIGRPVTRFPGAAALGACGSGDLARRVAAATGRELAALGVTWNLAPVADVNLEPDNPVIGLRSFGDDPACVADLVRAQVAGYQDDAGIVATVKHFPGHGDTTTDSHLSLPVIAHDERTLRAVDLPPFAAAVEAGVAAVMPGHLLVPAFDDVPATFSRRLLRGMLRDELGFDGVVVTDGLYMRAIRDRVAEPGELAVRALAAGVDVLLMPPAVDATVAAVSDAVAEGVLSPDRITDACRRVLELKQRQGLLEDGWEPAARLPDSGMLREHRDLEQTVATSAVTLVRAAEDPPAPVSGPALVVGPAGPAAVLADALGAASVAVSADPDTASVERVLAAAGGASTVVVVRHDPRAGAGQDRLVDGLARAGRRLVTASIGLPYAADVPRADVALAVMDDGDAAMRGLATALVEGRFTGRVPVTAGR